MSDGFGTSPQFDTAQYSQPTTNSCSFCGVAIKSTYFRLNQKMSCENCAKRIETTMPRDSRSTFVRSILFGLLGCVLGVALYATVEIATGRIFGLISIAVGWIVGTLMMKGSKGVGGRRYQVMAVLLTYVAISVSFVPVLIAEFVKNPKLAQEMRTKAAQKNAAPVTPATPAAPATTPATPATDASDAKNTAATPADAQQTPAVPVQAAPQKAPRGVKSATEVLIGVGALLLLGLASPFLQLADPAHGIINLLILFFGLQIAWRLGAGKPQATIEGPYTV